MIAVGVDTHKHEHLAKALDGLGQVLGGLQIKANLQGYLELLRWLRALGEDVVVGIGVPAGEVRSDRRAGGGQEGAHQRGTLHAPCGSVRCSV